MIEVREVCHDSLDKIMSEWGARKNPDRLYRGFYLQDGEVCGICLFNQIKGKNENTIDIERAIIKNQAPDQTENYLDLLYRSVLNALRDSDYIIRVFDDDYFSRFGFTKNDDHMEINAKSLNFRCGFCNKK